MTAPSDQDRVCAALAKASLFPKRMHRDAADASHFPALLQLDLLRGSHLMKSLTNNASISSVFPRHVVVVRNLASGGDGIQWNGEPDYKDPSRVSFDVIPEHLSVRCTNDCNRFLTSKFQRAFLRTLAGSTEEKEIVLCSDRILQRDSHDSKYKGVAKELPPKSFRAVEEVLAHELVKIRSSEEEKEKKSGQATSNTSTSTADVEVEAARAAECYFSRHTYDKQKQIKKGSRLQAGYSVLPSSLQGWCMSKCLSAVATDHLVSQSSMSKDDAKEAVQEAMKNQNQL